MMNLLVLWEVKDLVDCGGAFYAKLMGILEAKNLNLSKRHIS
jgi:hypothetical protein